MSNIALKTEISDGVLILTLNRPDARNAMSRDMLDALADTLDEAEQSEDVAVVVLAAAGSAFCAGGDVKLLSRGESIFGAGDSWDDRQLAQAATQRRTVVRLHEYPKPTLAAVQGATVGAGLGLALACDLRLAAASATFRAGFARVGLAGDFGATWLLRELAGPARAKELLLLDEVLSAERAEAIGLVNRVVADADLMDTALAAARHMAAFPKPAVRTIKEHVARAGGHGLAHCADIEVREHIRLLQTVEHRALIRTLVDGGGAGR